MWEADIRKNHEKTGEKTREEKGGRWTTNKHTGSFDCGVFPIELAAHNSSRTKLLSHFVKLRPNHF